MKAVSSRYRRIFATFAVLVAALSLAACGSSSSSSSSEAPTSAEAESTTPAGPAPKGEPFKIGMGEDLSGPVGAFPEQKVAAEAAVQYVNDKLGGAGDRPVEFVNCASDGTPESALQCANELVSKHIDVVIGGNTQGGSPTSEVFFRNNVPMIGGQPLDEVSSTSKLAFFFGPAGGASFGALVAYMAEKEFAKVGVVGPDVPIVNFVSKLIQEQGQEAGIPITVGTYPPSSPAFEPAVTKATTGGAEGLIASDVPAGCVGTMKAVQALGLDLTMGLPHSCATQEVFEAAPSLVLEKGVFQFPSLPVSAKDPDVEEYVEIMEDFGASASDINAENAQSIVQAVMNIAALGDEISEAGEKFTTTSLVAALRKTHEHENFMGHPYTCDGKQVPFVPSICTPYARIVQYQGGEIVDIGKKWFNVLG